MPSASSLRAVGSLMVGGRPSALACSASLASHVPSSIPGTVDLLATGVKKHKKTPRLLAWGFSCVNHVLKIQTALRRYKRLMVSLLPLAGSILIC